MRMFQKQIHPSAGFKIVLLDGLIGLSRVPRHATAPRQQRSTASSLILPGDGRAAGWHGMVRHRAASDAWPARPATQINITVMGRTERAKQSKAVRSSKARILPRDAARCQRRGSSQRRVAPRCAAPPPAYWDAPGAAGDVRHRSDSPSP